jgi:hypothetical protein
MSARLSRHFWTANGLGSGKYLFWLGVNFLFTIHTFFYFNILSISTRFSAGANFFSRLRLLKKNDIKHATGCETKNKVICRKDNYIIMRYLSSSFLIATKEKEKHFVTVAGLVKGKVGESSFYFYPKLLSCTHQYLTLASLKMHKYERSLQNELTFKSLICICPPCTTSPLYSFDALFYYILYDCGRCFYSL